MIITGTDRFYENTINMVMKEVYERRSLVNIDKIVVVEDDSTRKSTPFSPPPVWPPALSTAFTQKANS